MAYAIDMWDASKDGFDGLFCFALVDISKLYALIDKIDCLSLEYSFVDVLNTMDCQVIDFIVLRLA